jgi:hypothetical protein
MVHIRKTRIFPGVPPYIPYNPDLYPQVTKAAGNLPERAKMAGINGITPKCY